MIFVESEKDERHFEYLPRYAHIYSAKVGIDVHYDIFL